MKRFLSVVAALVCLGPAHAETETPDQIAADCRGLTRCQESYARHRLLTQQEWNETEYNLLKGRYDAISNGWEDPQTHKREKGKHLAQAAELTKISPTAGDWFGRMNEWGKMAPRGGECHIKPESGAKDVDSWAYINQMLACQMSALSSGRRKAIDWLKQLQAAQNKKLFQDMVYRKVDHVLPPPMGDKKLTVVDLIYIYLDRDGKTRKYIIDKWAFFDRYCAREAAPSAAQEVEEASRFLNGGQPLSALPDVKAVCKGDIGEAAGQFKKEAKKFSKDLRKDPSRAFDKSGNLSTLDDSSVVVVDGVPTVGGVPVSQPLLTKRVAPTSVPSAQDLLQLPITTRKDLSLLVPAPPKPLPPDPKSTADSTVSPQALASKLFDEAGALKDLDGSNGSRWSVLTADLLAAEKNLAGAPQDNEAAKKLRETVKAKLTRRIKFIQADDQTQGCERKHFPRRSPEMKDFIAANGLTPFDGEEKRCQATGEPKARQDEKKEEPQSAPPNPALANTVGNAAPTAAVKPWGEVTRQARTWGDIYFTDDRKARAANWYESPMLYFWKPKAGRLEVLNFSPEHYVSEEEKALDIVEGTQIRVTSRAGISCYVVPKGTYSTLISRGANPPRHSDQGDWEIKDMKCPPEK